MHKGNNSAMNSARNLWVNGVSEVCPILQVEVSRLLYSRNGGEGSERGWVGSIGIQAHKVYSMSRATTSPTSRLGRGQRPVHTHYYSSPSLSG